MANMSLTSVIMSTLVHAHHASSTLASLCDPADGDWKLAVFVLVPSASLIQHAFERSEMFIALCGQSHGLHLVLLTRCMLPRSTRMPRF